MVFCGPQGSGISIHALLAESDPRKTEVPGAIEISIHALLAESDTRRTYHKDAKQAFLSTLSLRRATSSSSAETAKTSFLSTLSLRRATWHQLFILLDFGISIHALLAESDDYQSNGNSSDTYFYPRSPCGERHLGFIQPSTVIVFLSTLSLRRATCVVTVFRGSVDNFYPRSPCGERQSSCCRWQ